MGSWIKRFKSGVTMITQNLREGTIRRTTTSKGQGNGATISTSVTNKSTGPKGRRTITFKMGSATKRTVQSFGAKTKKLKVIRPKWK